LYQYSVGNYIQEEIFTEKAYSQQSALSVFLVLEKFVDMQCRSCTCEWHVSPKGCTFCKLSLSSAAAYPQCCKKASLLITHVCRAAETV
jgi:hypothetical protein